MLTHTLLCSKAGFVARFVEELMCKQSLLRFLEELRISRLLPLRRLDQLRTRYICRDEAARSARRDLLTCTAEFQHVLASDQVQSVPWYAAHVQVRPR
jgi:hypothetical protein